MKKRKSPEHGIEYYEKYIGTVVIKKSGRPFKSTFQKNTIKGVKVHSKTGRPAFTFVEDGSEVECEMCSLPL